MVRRIAAIALFVFLFVVLTTSLPVWLPLALVTDLVRRKPLPLTRFLLFLFLFLGLEMLGLFAAFAVWLRFRLTGRIDGPEYLRSNFALQKFWARSLGRGAFRIFNIRVTVVGEKDWSRRPFILLIRHISTADTILASNFVSVPQDIMLRYVLKEELLWDPCLNVVGQRLPNCFIGREGERSSRAPDQIRKLAEGMKPGEGLLLYPEGTRFTEKKRRRILEKLRASGDEEASHRAEALRGLLPPRRGGLLAALQVAPEADVVFLAHTGFENARSFADFWDGRLIGRSVHLRFWRVPAEEIPASDDARMEWIWSQWERMAREIATEAAE